MLEFTSEFASLGYSIEADLPLPYVFYPGGGGPFFCFSDAADGELFFCECFRQALYTYMKQKERALSRPGIAGRLTAIEASLFPERVSGGDAIAQIRFKDCLCHQCNKISPILRYAGLTPYAKTHHWYIQKRLLEYGFPIIEGAESELTDETPDELHELQKRRQLCAEEIAAADFRRQSSLYKQKAELTKQIERIVEREVKELFGAAPKKTAVATHAKNCRSLPMKYALYPQSEYGAFIVFSEKRDGGALYLCECAKEVTGHILSFYGTPPDGLFPKEYMPYIENGSITFREKLCHRCNAEKLHSHEIPIAYQNLKYLEYGILRFFTLSLYNSMLCPPHIKPLIDNYMTVARNPYSTAAKNLRSQIDKLIEGDVQGEFGHARRGERWASESALYRMVRALLPNSVIFTHKRFHWMYYLEFDIYVEDLRLAIEYQGIQHFKPQEHWGGQRALEETRERDEIKAELCREHGIDLITFNYDEELTEALVRHKLSGYIAAGSGGKLRQHDKRGDY